MNMVLYSEYDSKANMNEGQCEGSRATIQELRLFCRKFHNGWSQTHGW